ncbi:MAG TPA: glycoside hydrolase family 125 protein [Flavihumibacter sp.]|jgi:meiotically up-regulated gene 157 (Mug157) protein
MKRRHFLQTTGLLGAGVMLNRFSSFAAQSNFPEVRVPLAQRRFTSKAVEETIKTFQAAVKNRELAWLFGNCFPNTLDTTVFHEVKDGVPDTYVITGDIDAMWLRDSSAQVWPYLQLIKEDPALKQLIAGLINRQTRCILKDPYANAFYKDADKKGEWASDHTAMQSGVHERKWEIDSLCYPIRLAYHYWKTTGDTSPFGSEWKQAIQTTYKVFREQQRKEGLGSYRFQRTTPFATDTQPMKGYGYPVKPVGLICSAFRPSDDATVFQFLIPSNFFAVVSLRQAAEMLRTISKDNSLAQSLVDLANEVERAIKQHAIVEHKKYGKVYAYEVDGFGSSLLMDDANVPSLLSLPYLGAVSSSDPVYRNTRKLILSEDNPFYFKGKAAEGIGGPHVGQDMIWPMAIIMKAITSDNDREIADCIETLRKTHGDTGFMHESFHKDDPKNFTRSWFAWANTLFGELLWKIYRERKHLLT